MKRSQVLHTTDVVPSHIMDAQCLAATEHYPGYTFSLEFDNLLLEEVHRCRLYHICTAKQLESFEILLDNFLGTKKLGLIEFSALHGRYLQHQDYPTVLHLQHRYVALLQSHEHHRGWTPKSTEIASLLRRRDKFLRLLKQQVQRNNIEVACYNPYRPHSEMNSERKSPLAVNAVRGRRRGAPKLGRKPLKDKSVYIKLQGQHKVPTPKKSLPPRKARKNVSYAEEVIVHLDFPQPEPFEKHSKAFLQESGTRSANKVNLGCRKREHACPSKPFPIPLNDSQGIEPSRHESPSASQPHLSPNGLSGISKPYPQTHLARFKKDFLTGCRREVLHTPIDSSRFLGNRRPTNAPIDVHNPANIQTVIEGEDVHAKCAISSPPETGHATIARNTEIDKKLENMEVLLRIFKQNIENKVNDIEGQMRIFEQVVRMNIADMQSGQRTDIRTTRLEMKEMHSDVRKYMENMCLEMGKALESKIDVGIETMQAEMRRSTFGKSLRKSTESIDTNRNGMEPLTEVHESTVPKNAIFPCQDDTRPSDNQASKSGLQPIESELLNDGDYGNASGAGDSNTAPNAEDAKAEEQILTFSTFLLKALRKRIFPAQ